MQRQAAWCSNPVSLVGLAVLFVGLSGLALAQSASSTPATLVAPASGSLQLSFTVAGNPVEIQRDTAGTYSFTGLPFPGEVLYVPKTGTVYYLHPEEPIWLAVPPAQLNGQVATLLPKAGPAWTPYLDQPTRRWDIKAQRHDNITALPNPASAQECAPAFTSVHAAQVSGLTIADLQRVILTLQWLNSGLPAEALSACDVALATPTQAGTIGLPMVWTNLIGNWQLTGLNTAAVGTFTIPTNTQFPDAEVRLRLLLVQLSPPERIAFIQQNSSLPIGQQVSLLASQLTQESMP
jgi:hypothetical protein